MKQPGSSRSSESSFTNQTGNKGGTRCCFGLNKLKKMAATSRACRGSLAGLTHQLLSCGLCVCVRIFFTCLDAKCFAICWKNKVNVDCCYLTVLYFEPKWFTRLQLSTVKSLRVYISYLGVGRMDNASVLRFWTRDGESCTGGAANADYTAGTGNHYLSTNVVFFSCSLTKFAINE